MSGKVDFCYNPKKKDESYFQQNEKVICLKDIKVVWFRKFGFLKTYEDHFGSNNDLLRYLHSEFNLLRSIILDLLNDKEWLFNRKKMPSKLRVLEVAHECELNIPETLITSSKIKLDFFFKQNQNSIISKSLGEGKNLEFENEIFPFFTQKIETIDIVDRKFSPSFFQKCIVKEYELRIFYIGGQFYSMVIFSQNNPKTIDDFRNYDTENPNRFEPYMLPENIEFKLHKMMNLLGLNTGSIDMIKAIDGNYYFLEINPSGQFGMTGVPCNYPLFEVVADYLISKSKK
jgi:ATP-GRASP peptide maturase of grasp-with-spasm system